MAENKRAIKTYVVSSLNVADDVMNAAVGNHKVLNLIEYTATAGEEVFGVTVLHSAKYQLGTEKNAMVLAMPPQDQARPENQY
jgi:hypothetical protein